MVKRTRAEQGTKPKPDRKPKGSGLVLSGIPRVNLLPAAELQRRSASVLIRRWIAGLAATALVVSGLVAAAYWERSVAEQQLAAEQARTMDLNLQLAALSHVSQAIVDRAALAELRTTAMGNDLVWRPLFADVIRTLPRGAQLTGYELVTGGNPTKDADPATEISLFGQLTVTTADPADQNRMIDKLRTLDSFLAVDAGALTVAEPVEKGYTFIVEVVVNQTYYSGDHLPEVGAR